MLSARRIMFLSSLGGAFEMYDFIVYVMLTPYLAQLFFPSDDNFAALLSTFAVFALGYLVRPFGGILFGHLGDKFGRKKMFVASIFLMSIPVLLIGLLPTYDSIGRTAPLLLILLRLVQGMAVGGEIPGAMTFTTEYVAPAKRGLAGGTIYCGLNYGIAFATLVVAFLTTSFDKNQMLSFGWRIPFILGGLLGILAVYLRSKASESPLFIALKEQNKLSRLPLKTLLHGHLSTVISAILITGLGAGLLVVGFAYIKEYLVGNLNYPLHFASWLIFWATLISASLQIFFGWLSDKWGRVRLLAVSYVLTFILLLPIFYLLALDNQTLNIVGMMLMSLIGAMVIGVYPTFLIELFPTQVRYSGYGLSYNIAFATFGGLSPLIVTALMHSTHNLLMPAFYLMAATLISLIGLFWARKTRYI